MEEYRPYFESNGKDPCSIPHPTSDCQDPQDIIEEFSICMTRGDTPDSSAAQSTAEKWEACINGCNPPDLPSICPETTAQYITEALTFYHNHNEETGERGNGERGNALF